MTEKSELTFTSWQRSNVSPSTKLTVEGSIVGSNMGAPKIVFTSQTAAPVMTIHPDGKITLGDDAEPTEAAAACIEVMDGMIQNLIRNAVQKERNLIVSWCRNVNIDWCRCDDAIERGDHLKEELK